MKTILLIFICCSLRFYYPSDSADVKVKVHASYRDTINFKTQVQPILEKHCSPCHFTGGKMYDRLPFDQALTLIQRKKAITRRLKNEDDKNLVEAFLFQREN